MTPNIGDLVDYGENSFRDGPGKFRVTAWVKYEYKPVDWGDMAPHVIAAIEEVCGPPKLQLRYCTRSEATHLFLTGICGAMAPVDKVVKTGVVSWDKKSLATERREFKKKIGQWILR